MGLFYAISRAARVKSAEKLASLGAQSARGASEMELGAPAAKAWGESADFFMRCAKVCDSLDGPHPDLIDMSGRAYNQGAWMREGALAEARCAQGCAAAQLGDYGAATAFWRQARKHIEASPRLAARGEHPYFQAIWASMGCLHESARAAAMLPGADAQALMIEADEGAALRLRMLRHGSAQAKNEEPSIGQEASDLIASVLDKAGPSVIQSQALADKASIALSCGARMQAFGRLRESLSASAMLGPLRGPIAFGSLRHRGTWAPGFDGLAASAELSMAELSDKLARSRAPGSDSPDSPPTPTSPQGRL